MKNSIDTIGNRNRDLPVCSAVPQPTAPPRAPVRPITSLNAILMISNFSIPLLQLHALPVWTADILILKI
jgi:hypothetical protein